MVAVAIRADDFIRFGSVEAPLHPASNDLFGRDIISLMAALTSTSGSGLVRVPLQPASDDILGRDIMSFMAASTEGVDFVSRVYGFGRGYVVFIVLVCGRLAVAIDAANVGLGMVVSKGFGLIIGMAYKASCICRCSSGRYNGSPAELPDDWFVEEQRSTCIDYKGRRPSCIFALVLADINSPDVTRLRLGCS